MEPSVASAIQQTYETCNTWSASYIMLDVCKSLNSPETVEYNFGGTIGRNTAPGPRKKAVQPVQLYLPPEYNQNSPNFREKNLAPLFSHACARQGFSVVIKGWDKDRQCLRFRCQRGRKHKEATTRKGKVRFCYRYHFLNFVLFVTGIILKYKNDTGIILVLQSTNKRLTVPTHCRMTVGLIGNNEFEAVEQWLYSFMDSVETLQEEEQSLGLLKHFLQEEERNEMIPVSFHYLQMIPVSFHYLQMIPVSFHYLQMIPVPYHFEHTATARK
jgi:hypothetical protein